MDMRGYDRFDEAERVFRSHYRSADDAPILEDREGSSEL